VNSFWSDKLALSDLSRGALIPRFYAYGFVSPLCLDR